MIDRRTLEDSFLERGLEIAQSYPCPICQKQKRPFEIVLAPEFEAGVACSVCVMALDTPDNRLIDLAPVADSWDSEIGAQIKARRNIELDKWAWTIRPDSPLKAANIAAWADYLSQLHSLTIDFAGPQKFSFPLHPALEYAGKDEIALRIAQFVRGLKDE